MSKSLLQEDRWISCLVAHALFASIAWINEAITMSSAPANNYPRSYTVLFEAPNDSFQMLWDKVKTIASLYDAAVACARHGTVPFSNKSDLAMIFQFLPGSQSNPEPLPRAVRAILGPDSLTKYLVSWALFPSSMRNTRKL
jgi:hypothetical protein